MKALDTPLIADRQARQLSALGFKQLNRIIGKAAEANGTHRYAADFKPLRAQVEALVKTLVFDYNITKDQLSALQRSIKVVDNRMVLPEHFFPIN